MISIIFLWFFIILLTLSLFKQLNIQKNYLMCFCITLFIIFFVLNLENCISSAIEGCTLVVNAIIPTIFPFSVICNLLIYYDGITLYSKILGPLICKPLGLSKACSFPIAASFISGYPLGAKYSSQIYSLGYINKNEYERLLNIASNAGPIFLLGSVATTMLSNEKLGYILLISNYLSIIIVGFLTKKKSNDSNPPLKTMIIKNITNEKNFGTALKDSIENAIFTTLNISAFVILFSVFISIIKSNTLLSIAFQNLESFINIPKDSLYNLFLGSIEFANGCKLISSSPISINLKLGLISFICSFSSLSVIAQVSSVVSANKPSIKKYIIWKFIQGIISFSITFIVSKILPITTFTSAITNNNYTFFIYYKIYFPLLCILFLTLICTIIYDLIKKLHSS